MNILENRAVRLTGNRDHVTENFIAEGVKGHFNANDLRPAYRALKKLHLKPAFRVNAIKPAGCMVSDMDGQRSLRDKYF